MPSSRWKDQERRIAQALGGQRVLQLGNTSPDVAGDDFVAEVKDRKRVSREIYERLSLIESHRKRSGKPYAMLVYTTPGEKPVYLLTQDTFLRLWNARSSK